MGIRKPDLRALVARAQNGPPDRKALGPARALIQCRRHGNSWRTVGWVHGNAVVGTSSSHDLPHAIRATYEVKVRCVACPRTVALDLPAIRERLTAPHGRLLKLDVDDVTSVSGGSG